MRDLLLDVIATLLLLSDDGTDADEPAVGPILTSAADDRKKSYSTAKYRVARAQLLANVDPVRDYHGFENVARAGGRYAGAFLAELAL